MISGICMLFERHTKLVEIKFPRRTVTVSDLRCVIDELFFC